MEKAKKFAYHCTDTDPETILREGFKSGRGGYTPDRSSMYGYEDPREVWMKHVKEKFLPKNPMFVSDLKAEVWSRDAKYCLKIDVSGLEAYPDYPSFLDCCRPDFDCGHGWFDWYAPDGLEDIYISEMRSFLRDMLAKRAAKRRNGHIVLPASSITGSMTRDLFGTFVIDGDLLTRERVVAVRDTKLVDKHDALRYIMTAAHENFCGNALQRKALEKMCSNAGLDGKATVEKLSRLASSIADCAALESFDKEKALELCRQLEHEAEALLAKTEQNPALRKKHCEERGACRELVADVREFAEKLESEF